LERGRGIDGGTQKKNRVEGDRGISLLKAKWAKTAGPSGGGKYHVKRKVKRKLLKRFFQEHQTPSGRRTGRYNMAKKRIKKKKSPRDS